MSAHQELEERAQLKLELRKFQAMIGAKNEIDSGLIEHFHNRIYWIFRPKGIESYDPEQSDNGD